MTPLLAVLILGHVLADHLLSGEGRAHGAPHGPARHVLTVMIVLAAAAAPFVQPVGLLLVPALAVLHLPLHRGREVLAARGWPGTAFLVENVAHLLLLDAAAFLLARDHAGPLLREAGPGLSGWALLAAALVFNATSAGDIVRSVLNRFPALVAETSGGGDAQAMGRTIGVLERVLIVLLAWAGEWTAVGLVLAAKSIARFKDLDHRPFGEYYVIGTLTSVLIAVGTVLALRILVSPHVLLP